jgi:hypothetical protein
MNRVNRTFMEAPFGLERLSVLLREARIHDAGLQERYQAFVVSCYVPARAMYAPSGSRAGSDEAGPFLNPFNIPYDAYRELWPVDFEGRYDPNRKCDAEARDLWKLLYDHTGEAAALKETAQEVERLVHRNTKPGSGAFTTGGQAFVLNQVVYNETAALFAVASGEIARLQQAVPDYGLFRTSQQTSSNPQDFIDVVRSIISFIVKAKQSIDQWFQHHAAGPALYYQVTTYAPYVYGLSMMVITAMFPVAALAAFWPWRWTALLTWAKYLLWIKLWMVFWAMLAAFNKARYEFTTGSDPSSGIGDQSYIFPAIAAMYLLSPGLALLVVQLLDAAKAGAVAAISHFATGASGPPFFQVQKDDQGVGASGGGVGARLGGGGSAPAGPSGGGAAGGGAAAAAV